MSPTLPFSAFVPESTSDGFGVLLYESQTPSWDIAAKLVAGGEREQSRRFLVTTSDGATTTEVPREEFLAAPHADDVLTISADWFLDDGTMDGYVLGTFKQLSGKALEYYQYGTLGQLEGQFIDLLFRRFKSLVDTGARALLAIDAGGSSTEEDWHKVFDGTGQVPKTATVLATSMGEFRLVSSLAKSPEWRAMTVLTPAAIERR